MVDPPDWSGRAARADERFAWVDRDLVATSVAGVAITVFAGLLQVSFGAFSMTLAEAWAAVFAPAVWGNPGVLLTFFVGEGPAQALGFSTDADLSKRTLVVWNIRLPRLFVAGFVGFNLAISGAIFQAVTRNELASRFVLGVSSGAGLAILLTLVVFTGAASLLPVTAALGGTAAFLAVYAIAWKGGTSPVRLGGRRSRPRWRWSRLSNH